jgi:hypothetical protein
MEKMKKTLVADPAAERRLLEALQGKSRGRTELVRVTRADAVALSGIATEQAEPALKSLARTYRSHLAVTEEGELVYAFDPSLERRDKIPLGEKVRNAAMVLYAGFKWFFKVWIAVTLVAYVVAFIAMMLALIVAQKGDDRDDRRGGGLGPVWLWYWLMPDLAPADPYYQQRRRQLQLEGPKKRFYLVVFDYVFGPKGAPIDPKESDKRLLSFLRDHKGRVTATELSALTGLALPAAEEEMTRLMVEYNGEAEVAPDGTLLYVFDEILPSAEATPAKWSWAWERNEKLPSLTGNTPGGNVAVTAFSAFNLIASLTVGPAFLHRFRLDGNPWASFFVTLFPLIFSAIFFAIPAVRLIARRRKEKKLARQAVRNALLREIWHTEKLDPAQAVKTIAERMQQPAELVQKALDKLLAELDGEVDTDAEGRISYRFPRLADEKKAALAARAAAVVPALGPVEFTSET